MEEYFFEYRTSVKGRMFDKKLIDVLSNEFNYRTKEYFLEAIELSVILVNNNKVSPNYILKPEDVIFHTLHIHQPNDISVCLTKNFQIPKINSFSEKEQTIFYQNLKNIQHNSNDNSKNTKNIEIIDITEDFIVVNKPHGIASHPTSGYISYSLTEILYNTVFKNFRDEKQIKLLKQSHVDLISKNRNNFSKEVHQKIIEYKNKLQNMFSIGCINRLDVVTTGIVILSFNNKNKHHTNIASDKIKKTYLAKVEGHFLKTKDEIKTSWKKFLLNENFNDFKDLRNKYEDYFICTESLKKNGIKMEIHNEGKISLTLFKLIKICGTESIIECIPITGRTHQIRIHLSFLGHPILNDPFYGRKNFDLEKKGKKCTKFSENLKENFIYKNCEGENSKVCKNRDYFICLHALKYKIDNKTHVSELPDWY